jgi:hypothetical protein
MAIIKTNIILIMSISDIHSGVNVTHVPLSSHEIKHWRTIDCRVDSPKVIEQIGSINRRLQVQILSSLLTYARVTASGYGISCRLLFFGLCPFLCPQKSKLKETGKNLR